MFGGNNREVTTTTLIIRAGVGMYLMYLAYSLKDAIISNNGLQRVVFIGFTLLFLAVGAVLIFNSIKKIIKSNKETDIDNTNCGDSNNNDENNLN